MFHTEYFSNAISIKDDNTHSDKDLNISGFIDNVQFTLKINNDIYIGAGVFDMSTPLLILIPSNEKRMYNSLHSYVLNSRESGINMRIICKIDTVNSIIEHTNKMIKINHDGRPVIIKMDIIIIDYDIPIIITLKGRDKYSICLKKNGVDVFSFSKMKTRMNRVISNLSVTDIIKKNIIRDIVKGIPFFFEGKEIKTPKEEFEEHLFSLILTEILTETKIVPVTETETENIMIVPNSTSTSINGFTVNKNGIKYIVSNPIITPFNRITVDGIEIYGFSRAAYRTGIILNTGTKKYLLDAGIYFKENIDFILISHGHMDHVASILNYQDVPIICPKKIRRLITETPEIIPENIKIVKLFHGKIETNGYIIDDKIGFFTDTEKLPDYDISTLKIIIIECTFLSLDDIKHSHHKHHLNLSVLKKYFTDNSKIIWIPIHFSMIYSKNEIIDAFKIFRNVIPMI